MDPKQALAWTDNLKQPLQEVRHAVGEAEQAIRPYRRSLEQAIVDNPIKAVGVSLAIGVFLGWLIKRS
jgi:ElaB/YqjD/DUF883 family membrane-anchored ribosome-binding protein